MPQIFATPVRNARAKVQVSDFHLRSVRTDESHWYNQTAFYDTKVEWGVPTYIYLPWDQVVSLIGAIEGMAERAKQGIIEGTNRAAERVRRHIVNSVADEITLDRDRIEDAVAITAEAGEDQPAAQVSVIYVQESLLNYQINEGPHGVEAYVRRDDGQREIPASFLGVVRGRLGAFQRRIVDGHRAGRLPIQEKMGPSVYSTVEQTPGMLDREVEYARSILVRSIMQVRDEIVSDFTDRQSLLSAVFGSDVAAPAEQTADIVELLSSGVSGIFAVIRRRLF